MIDGLTVVDKPAGMTSHDVVARCRRIFGQRRVGHAGTLDPDATGVLLVGLGRATRLLQFLTGHPKCYRAEIVLGVATSTQDDSGMVTGTWDLHGVGLEAAQAAAAELTGTIQQIPPMVSAVRIGGRRLHQLAREGVEVERAPRTVTVFRFEVELAADQDPGAAGGGPVLATAVDCSAGTYVRTLAADLGTALGGGAHLRRLRRVAVGPWSVAEAVTLDDLDEGAVHSPAEALRGLPTVTVDASVGRAVGHGRVLGAEELGAPISGPDGPGGHQRGPWAVLDEGGELLAVYREHSDGRTKPVVVMAPPDR